MATKTKKKPAAPKKKSQDIPLDNIPERVRVGYSIAEKEKAIERYKAGEPAEQIARDMNISTGTLITKWVATVREGRPLTHRAGTTYKTKQRGEIPADFSAMLSAAVARAAIDRDNRLEAAAYIVENDVGGTEARVIAKKIREHKRAKTPST